MISERARVSKQFDELYEEAGRRIYEAQRARLKDQSGLAACRGWRSKDLPSAFWDGYCADARAALSVEAMSRRTRAPRLVSRNGSPGHSAGE